jgi:hypothetical protein
MAEATRKDTYLSTLDNEFATTMKVLRNYPPDQLDLRPAPRCRTARELGWTFVMERGLGEMVFNDTFADDMSGEMPTPPESWDELLETLESANARFRQLVADTPEAELDRKVRFFTGPGQMGEISRMDWLWFLLHDEIHHRGQFSIYLRMADAVVPSIYGPSADEPWM